MLAMKPSTITTESRLASRREIDDHIGAGRIDQARQLAKSAVAEWCSPTDHFTVDCVSALLDLAKLATVDGAHADYLQLVTRARNITLQVFGHDHPDAVHARLCLWDAHIALDDFDTAEIHLSGAPSDIERLGMRGSTLHANVLIRRAQLAIKLQRPQEAENFAVEAVVIYRRHNRGLWPYGLQTLAHALRANGKRSLAQSVLRKRQSYLDYWARLLNSPSAG